MSMITSYSHNLLTVYKLTRSAHIIYLLNIASLMILVVPFKIKVICTELFLRELEIIKLHIQI